MIEKGCSGKGLRRRLFDRLSAAADDGGDRVSSTEAECGASDVLVPVLQGVQQGGEDTCSGTSDGVTECDGSSVDVEDLVGNVELLLDGTGCGCEGLVVLEEVDIVDGHSGLLEDVLCRRDGSLHDVLGLHSALSIGLDGCEGLESVLLRPLPGCYDEG